MTPRCQGGCGKTVTEAGKWCSSCWLEPKQFQKDPTDVYPAGTWDPFDLFEKDPKPHDPSCPLCKGTEFNVCTSSLDWVFIECAKKGCHFTRSVIKANIITAAFMPTPRADETFSAALSALNAAGVPFIERTEDDEPREASDIDYHGQHESFRA